MSRGFLVWLLIMTVETIHGVLRGLLLAPHFGEAMTGRVGWPIGMIIVLVISYLSIRWIGLRGTSALLQLGTIWALLTFAFEIAIGYFRGLDREAIGNEINPLAGGLMVYSVIVMMLAPLVAAKLRRL
jgi:hypothetical protein